MKPVLKPILKSGSETGQTILEIAQMLGELFFSFFLFFLFFASTLKDCTVAESILLVLLNRPHAGYTAYSDTVIDHIEAEIAHIEALAAHAEAETDRKEVATAHKVAAKPT